MSTKKTRKTKNSEEFCFWTESLTKLLLSLYKEYQSKLDEGSMRHKVFWTLVVEGLKQKGHAFTTVQCSTKMDTLKRAYKKVKDHNSQTGNDKKTCEHFEILDEMFSKKPWIKPLSQAGSNLPMDDFDENEKEKSKSRRTNSVNHEKSEFMRQTLENQRLRAEATAEYRKHKLEILKDLSSKFNC
ncbi:trihelix transcription factor GTL1-like [Nasonia vitripennis]|uniref:Myb/SANT-like DNA-binding domain-containing protein n=1 Tax=Nasonia vitripennis TaxID=7425 RepID=A0A7M7GF01_NASVI|nr:trihelix transcription factor GTL1-like [Nasonia vitripennis]